MKIIIFERTFALAGLVALLTGCHEAAERSYKLDHPEGYISAQFIISNNIELLQINYPEKTFILQKYGDIYLTAEGIKDHEAANARPQFDNSISNMQKNYNLRKKGLFLTNNGGIK